MKSSARYNIKAKDSEEEFFSTEKDNTKELKTEQSLEGLERAKKEETKGVHPETIIIIPVTPRSKRMKTVRCLLDMYATNSLIDPALIDKSLEDYKGTQAYDEDKTSVWNTGGGEFKSRGHLTLSNLSLLSFTASWRFEAKLDLLARRPKGKHSYQVIIGMEDLEKLQIKFDLERESSIGQVSPYLWLDTDFGSRAISIPSGRPMVRACLKTRSKKRSSSTLVPA